MLINAPRATLAGAFSCRIGDTMATTYTQAKAVLDEIAARSEQNRKKLDQAKAVIVAADNDLGSMASAYYAFVSDLNALATANPDDAAIQAAKTEKDAMVTDFQALKTVSAGLRTAIGE